MSLCWTPPLLKFVSWAPGCSLLTKIKPELKKIEINTLRDNMMPDQ